MTGRILIVDDEPDIRFLLRDILEDEGYQVDIAEHAQAANAVLQNTRPDLILLDIWMPDVDGVSLLKAWKSSGEHCCPVVMMSGHGTVETAVEATKYGAFDFVEKPLSMAKLLSTVKTAISHSMQPDYRSRPMIEEPVGNSRLVQNLRQQMEDLAQTNHPVFLYGADGSGRKIWAEYLSRLSTQVVPMQVFDPAKDLASMMPLTANLYIAEVSDLDAHQQMQLQAALTGSASGGYRMIISSHYAYEQLVAEKQLIPGVVGYWRDAIQVPALEAHIEDIPELLEYYANWYSEQEQLPYRHFGVAVQNLLRNHSWQGNIAGLKAFIKTVLSQGDGDVELGEVKQLLQQSQSNTFSLLVDLDLDLREARELFEREYLTRHLHLSQGNIATLAGRVGQERTHLYRKLKALGLYSKKDS